MSTEGPSRTRSAALRAAVVVAGYSACAGLLVFIERGRLPSLLLPGPQFTPWLTLPFPIACLPLLGFDQRTPRHRMPFIFAMAMPGPLSPDPEERKADGQLFIFFLLIAFLCLPIYPHLAHGRSRSAIWLGLLGSIGSLVSGALWALGPSTCDRCSPGSVPATVCACGGVAYATSLLIAGWWPRERPPPAQLMSCRSG